MTFSLTARCEQTGQFGMVIASSSPAVAARCAHVRARTGVVASQNITDPALGPHVLDLMASGLSAPDAIATLRNREHIDYRQILAVDAKGRAAIHSGGNVLGIWGAETAPNAAAGGNLLANPGVPAVMLDAFASATGSLADRLMRALHAGLAAGGEAGPVHSAGLKVADRLDWPFIDLRVDWSETPIHDLQTAWDIYRPQAAAYVQRAEDPTEAPSYGVPGDE